MARLLVIFLSSYNVACVRNWCHVSYSDVTCHYVTCHDRRVSAEHEERNNPRNWDDHFILILCVKINFNFQQVWFLRLTFPLKQHCLTKVGTRLVGILETQDEDWQITVVGGKDTRTASGTWVSLRGQRSQVFLLITLLYKMEYFIQLHKINVVRWIQIQNMLWYDEMYPLFPQPWGRMCRPALPWRPAPAPQWRSPN